MKSAVVVGAGVIGATVAWSLVQAGCDVDVIDARGPGEGATRASAGVLAPFIEGAPASPLRTLGHEGLDLYDAFIAQLARDSGQPVIYARGGTLEVALTVEEAERLGSESGTLWQAGIEGRWVPPALLSDVEPAVSPEATGGLLVPMHGYVGVGSLTRAALAAAQARGARVHVKSGAVHISSGPQGGVVVRTAGRVYTADVAVMAAGSWSSQVTVEGADPIPVSPIRGQLLQLQAAPGLLRHVIWGTAGYLVPWPDGTVLVGATVEDVGFDESLTDEGCAGLRRMAGALIPALAEAPLVEARTGLRPKSPDDLPMIGRSSVVPALVYATGHYRNGVLLAPYTAQLVRRLVSDPLAPVPPEMRPDRFGVRV